MWKRSFAWFGRNATDASGIATQTVTGTTPRALSASAYLSTGLQIGTTQTLQVSAAPAIVFPTPAEVYGQSFTVTATSNSPGAFTYSVQSGPVTVQGSTVTATGVGPVTLLASQAASGNYSAGSATTGFTAVKASSTTTLAATLGSNSTASLSATVAPQFTGTPSGSVTFYHGSMALMTVPRNLERRPVLVLSDLRGPYELHRLHLQHRAADGLFDHGYPATSRHAVDLHKPATTGSVMIYGGQTPVGTYPGYAWADGYVFGLVLPALIIGSYALKAVYSGDANYVPGTSATVTVTVAPGPVQLKLSCGNTSLQLGQALSCTVDTDEGPLPVSAS